MLLHRIDSSREVGTRGEAGGLHASQTQHYLSMGKDEELLQAVKERNICGAHKILSKNRTPKPKLIGSSKRLNVNYQDSDGMCALHQAALVGSVEMMRLLLEYGAAPDTQDCKGMRPLHYAAWQGHEGPVKMLLNAKSSPNIPCSQGVTPLHLAGEHGHVSVTRLLLGYQADPTMANRQNKTPLDLACEFGHLRVVELLLESNQCGRLLYDNPGPDKPTGRTTCLHLAAKNGHSHIIKLLLQAGVDINLQTAQGTCLHEAALCGKLDVVRLLLDCGIDINKANSREQTALDIVNQFTTSRAAKGIKQLLKEATYALQARATGNYCPQEATHLAFREGDVIMVLEQHPSGMWKGYRVSDSNRTTGYFPCSMVVLVDTNKVGNSLSFREGDQKASTPPDLILQPAPSPGRVPSSPGSAPFTTVSIGSDEAFPPPPSPLVQLKNSTQDPDRDSGISPQQSSYSLQSLPSNGSYPGTRLHLGGVSGLGLVTPASAEQQTADWVGRHLAAEHDRSSLGSKHSPGGSSRNSIASSNSGGFLSTPTHHVNGHNRLSGQSYESGVSGVSAVSGASSSSRQSYHSASSSSLGSLDCLEDPAYCGTVNVQELFQQGYSDDEVLRAWLADLHFDEYYKLFVQAGYDMRTISRMTPEDLTAIGIKIPQHRKRLKSAISRLRIHDGIPDHKPNDISEWLALLRLPEYREVLPRQGYHDINAVTDITWEDLEEIGITKLGHQKKMILAIDRLRRIEMGARRLSQMEYKGSTEVLEPPSAYPTPAWLMNENRAASTSGDKPHSPRIVVSNELPSFLARRPHRSPSSENVGGLAEIARAASSIPPAGKRNQPAASNYEPDVVAIQVSKTSNVRGSSLPEDDPNQRIYHSFQSPITKGSFPVTDGDATPTNERKNIADTLEEAATSEAFIEEMKFTPKAKPVAKIVARTKRVSREFPSEPFEGFEMSGSSTAYSTATLPRQASKKQLDRIYDNPAELSAYIDGAVNAVTGGNKFAGRGRLSSLGSCGSGKSRKAPPPPPKRTNSMKSDFRFHRELLEKHASSFSSTDSGRRRSEDGEASNSGGRFMSELGSRLANNVEHTQQQQQQQKPTAKQEVVQQQLKQPRSPAPQPHHRRTSSKDRNEFPPPPPPLSATEHSVASLNSVIEQLEQHVSIHNPATGAQQQQQQNPAVNSDPAPHRKENKPEPAAAGAAGANLEPSASMGSIDSNTLPFANENVGTIKQRNPATKTSIVTKDGEGEEADLDASLFEDGSSTIKRNKKVTAAAENPKPRPPDGSVGPSSGREMNSGDAFDDIGNMLQGLADELDAMLVDGC